jgi:hypothetical protein
MIRRDDQNKDVSVSHWEIQNNAKKAFTKPRPVEDLNQKTYIYDNGRSVMIVCSLAELSSGR